MRRSPERVRAAEFVLAALCLASLLLGVGAAAGAAADDPNDTGGIGLVITVTPTPGYTSPRPTSTSAPTGGGSGGTKNSTTTTSTSPTPTATTTAIGEAGSDGFSLGGVLYVSGLRTENYPSLDPLSGKVHCWFVVKNVSKSTVTSGARIWLTNITGAPISETHGLLVNSLKPGETRVVEADLGGAGQWTFLTARFTLTPPKLVDGIELSPLTRDRIVVFLPWLVLVLISIALLGAIVTILVRGSVRANHRGSP